MIDAEIAGLVAKLLRDMPRNPTVIALGEAVKRQQMVTPVVTPAEMVTRNPKRDRAEYMRGYRRSPRKSAANGKPV